MFLKTWVMIQDISRFMIILAIVILFFLFSNSGLYAMDKADFKDKLKLTISAENLTRNERGEIMSVVLKSEIQNISNEEITFFYDRCGICFWQVSINGQAFRSMSMGVHVRPCHHHNKVTLKPGQSISMLHNGMNIVRGFGTPIKSLCLRYFPIDHNRFIESNNLDLL